ncbi:hypothetical protein C9I57_15675 [Trinickia symbiotica]|uniref:Uncharacterized protein n=1 Tax=Trinickia symbiotica TaxID=863227 RepID=A0A2T3XTK5_9BURK|nr:hypothetical protein C9I57_15675 [Trinickia symbiotica]
MVSSARHRDNAAPTAATLGAAAKSDFAQGGISDCTVGNVAWSTVITYNTVSAALKAVRSLPR